MRRKERGGKKAILGLPNIFFANSQIEVFATVIFCRKGNTILSIFDSLCVVVMHVVVDMYSVLRRRVPGLGQITW